MNYKQLVEAGYQYVWMIPKEKTTNTIGRLIKIAVVTDKLLEGSEFDRCEGENKDIAVFNQL
jgi:hypothetical protein